MWEPQQADALAEYDEENLPEPSAAEVRNIITEDRCDSARMQERRDTALRDEIYLQLKERILQGFPDHKNHLPEALKQYWKVRRELSIEDDLILYGCWPLIPTSMRTKTQAHVHAAHQGIIRTQQRACLTLYWPGMNNNIENMITACTQCLTLESHGTITGKTQTISRGSCRLVFTCWEKLPGVGGLLLRLAHHSSHGYKHHCHASNCSQQ